MDLLDNKTFKLTQLCRLCLAEDGLMVQLFGEESCGRKKPLPERILCCTTVEVKEGDGLPVVVCHRCLYYIDTFVDFRLKCQRVDAALHIFCNEIKAKGNREKSDSEESHPIDSVEPEPQKEFLKSDLTYTASEDEALEKSKGSDFEVKVNGNSECVPDSDSLPLESDMSSKDSRMGPSNKPYHCPHCNKPFTYKARLAAHIKTHGENQVYQADNMLQMPQQPLPQPPQASQHNLHHSVQQQSMQSQSMQAQGIQSPQLQHQLSPSANPYSSQQHTMSYGMAQSPLSQHMQQQTSVPQQYMSQQSMSHGSPRVPGQPMSPLHSMSPQHHPMQQSYHMQQQVPIHQPAMQQQISLQQQMSMQQQQSSMQQQQQQSSMQQQQSSMQQQQSSMQQQQSSMQQQQSSMQQQQSSMQQQQMSMQQQPTSMQQQQSSMQQQQPSMQQQQPSMPQTQPSLQQQQPSLQQQQSIQQQQSMQQQQSLQQQQSMQQQQPLQQLGLQQHGPMQHQAPMQHSQGIHSQPMHQQSQQQSIPQQQIMQQQSVGQSYDGRMYDMNYMPETPGTPPSSGSESSYNCSSCSASFMTPWMLADHVRSRCCDPNVSYNCEKCYSQFGSFNDLEQHKLSRSCENQVPSYYDAYTPPPSHYGMYAHQHQQDFTSGGGDMIDSRNTPSPWNVMATRSPGAVGNGSNSRSRMQRQDSYSTRSPQLGTMEELEKFAMSNTVVTSPLEPLASPGLTEPLTSAPSPLDPENSVQSVQSVQSTQSTQSSGSGSCGPRSNLNFNTNSSVRFGGPNFCGGNISANYGASNTNSSFMGGGGQNFGNINQNFGNSSPSQGFGSNIMMQNSPFGSNGNCSVDQNLNSNVAVNSQSMNFVEESNLSFGNSISSTYSKKSSSGCSSPQDSRQEVNANTKFCDDMNPHVQDQKRSPMADRIGSPLIDGEIKSRIKVNESLNINISDSMTGSCAEMLLTTSPGSSKGCMGGGDNPYSCQVCKASFASRTLFSNHMKTHAPDRSVKCNLCNNSFPTTAALRSHVDSVHSESGSEKSLHIVLDDSQSPGKMNENGNSDDSDDEPLSKLVVKPTPPPAKRRGRKPKSETENGEKPYGCVYCGKGFVTAVRLAIHTKLHTAEKPFKCDQCDKAFRSRAHLQRHVKTHAGDKPFKCVTCNKSFTVSMNLKIHMRTHTGERPYQCNLCKMAFIGYSHLYNHLKTHSDTQGPFTYTYFNKVYTTTGNFTLTKREKTARGRNRDKDVENDQSKEDEEIEQVKEVVRTINKSTTGKKRGRKAHFYEPEEDEEEVLEDDDEEEGIENSDLTIDFK